VSETLRPLAARYAAWLGLPDAATADISGEDPAQVRAMPLILRIERAAPPDRTPLLEAAAAAALSVCLDERAAPGGEWSEQVRSWIAGRIRKVARRARGAHWEAVQDLPGVTVSVGDAQVRALLPGLVMAAPKEISRLQISGSELPPDHPGPVPSGVPLLLLNPGVPMTVGKASAQVGHATMLLAALLEEPQLARWASDDYRVAVRTPTPAQWRDICPTADPEGSWRRDGVVAVRDAGFTEVAPGTITVLAQRPS